MIFRKKDSLKFLFYKFEAKNILTNEIIYKFNIIYRYFENKVYKLERESGRTNEKKVVAMET